MAEPSTLHQLRTLTNMKPLFSPNLFPLFHPRNPHRCHRRTRRQLLGINALENIERVLKSARPLRIIPRIRVSHINRKHEPRSSKRSGNGVTFADIYLAELGPRYKLRSVVLPSALGMMIEFHAHISSFTFPHETT